MDEYCDDDRQYIRTPKKTDPSTSDQLTLTIMGSEAITPSCRICGGMHWTLGCTGSVVPAKETAAFGPNVPESDPFRTTLLKNLDVLMLRLRPNARNAFWATLQTLYTDTPTRFTIISSLHQNDSTDRLHYSVAVNLTWGSLTFHVYGYWKTMFQITDVTIADNTSDVIAAVSFVKSDS